MPNLCVVCQAELTQLTESSDALRCECPDCGPYTLTGTAKAAIEKQIENVVHGRAKLSYALCGLTSKQPWVTIDSKRAEDLLANTELPKPGEQIDNLILWLGESQPSLGGACEITDKVTSIIGAVDANDVAFLVEHCKQEKLLLGNVERFGSGAVEFLPVQLTIAGWVRFEELQRGASTARSAFMAMQFGNAELDGIYSTHLRPAVAATGFDLRRVDEQQGAGLIDDHLRVKIHQCRFLIAELSDQNRGAYWEAGFAEGLGKPVIYMCRKDVFENRTLSTHFDTNHHLTVVWDPNNLDECVKQLKATIRATLPADAVLDDK